MNRLLVRLLSAVFVTAVTFASNAQAEEKLSEHLQQFAPYLGKTWKGEFTGSKPDKPVYDISRWERALNGRAIRVLHSVNDGQYGGESLLMWDEKQKSVVFWYFTTAGFNTHGTMKYEDGKWLGHETVTGATAGVTEVKSTSEILSDGRLHTKSQFLKDGKWVEGHEIFYTEAPDAKVLFK